MEHLYHYTTGAGLLGMMKNYSEENKNLTMWATHYMYMNDPTEYEYGRSICLDIIDDIEEELHIEEDKRIKKVMKTEGLHKSILKIRRRLKPEDIALCPYLISLSRAEDSLHMWNMYAINGNGIAISLNKEKLENEYHLKECTYYKKEVHYEGLKDRIKEHYNKDANKCKIENEHNRLFNAYYFELLISLFEGVFIKHSAYKDELETRIFAPSANKILFRERNGLIIPYVEQQIPFECVENIIVGPTADFNRICESILLLLNNKGIEWGEERIIKSKVPYRV